MTGSDDTNRANTRKGQTLLQPWTSSKSEEIIAAAWLIAGLNSWLVGIHWLAWILFAKSASDVVCAVAISIIEIKRDSGVKK